MGSVLVTIPKCRRDNRMRSFSPVQGPCTPSYSAEGLQPAGWQWFGSEVEWGNNTKPIHFRWVPECLGLRIAWNNHPKQICCQ